MHKIMLALIGLTFTVSSYGEIAKAPLDLSIHESYRSVRAMGMGGAFTAVANDHSAILINPAALARRKDGVVRMLLGGGFSDSFLGFADDISQVSDEGTEDEQIDNLTALLESKYGENFNLHFPRLGGFWARPNWGIAIMPLDTTVDLNVNRQAGPALNISVYQDTTIAYGWARDVDWLNKWFGWDGQLSVGVTGKAINRVFFGQSIIAADLAANDPDYFSEDAAAEGMTFDFDLGLLYTPKIESGKWYSFLKVAEPTFAVVMRNLLDYGFTTNLGLIGDGDLEPPKLQRRLDLGSTWDLPNFWVLDPRLNVDLKNMLHENWSFSKGLHIGAEVFWEMYSWWKGHWAIGLHQTYVSAGVGMKFGVFQLDLATYGEEVGTTDDPVEDRRFLIEMSLDF